MSRLTAYMIVLYRNMSRPTRYIVTGVIAVLVVGVAIAGITRTWNTNVVYMLVVAGAITIVQILRAGPPDKEPDSEQ
ncbi:hypothetical protein [Acrocarpospora sp. B8E8]|uniref:hypothetical protein n=1 Tax=Acrocarpospora sp. B8E8 TaxID=3153572 RepID=UPI00325F00B8